MGLRVQGEVWLGPEASWTSMAIVGSPAALEVMGRSPWKQKRKKKIKQKETLTNEK